MMVLGIDPGKTTGVAIVTYQGIPYDTQNASMDKMKAMLSDESLADKIDQIVMEQFVLYRNKAQRQTGSKMPASKVIGMVELWASMNEIPIKYQMSNVLPIAVKFSGIKPKGSHSNNHWVDAFNHAYYWLVTQKGLKPHNAR